MKKHNGMRPHDIPILLKITTKGNKSWLMKDLAIELGISGSEVSESLNRSVTAGLISENKKMIMKSALLEFLQFGLRYIYPQQPGPLVRGIPTAYSALPLAELVTSKIPLVWPYPEGNLRGQALEPLYPRAPEACIKDQKLYELLALTDALRIGRNREKKLAMEELVKRIE